MTDAIPIVAIILSVIGLFVSVLNYLRDRAKVQAWAEIIHFHKGPLPDSTTPMLRIRIANLGRRPIVLLHLALEGEGQRWFLHIRKPESPRKTLTVRETDELLERHFLAQNSATRVLEGDVLDLAFWPDDSDRFVSTQFDTAVQASRMHVEDCTGRRYRVKNDTQSLQKLFSTGSSND